MTRASSDECPPLSVTGRGRKRTGRGRALLLPALAGSVLCAGCSEQEPPSYCQERTKRCLHIDSSDVEIGGVEYFEIQLTNVCPQDIEYKLCFEVPGEGADCRQSTLARAQHADRRIALSRFGGRTRIFVRFVSEAKACRFPLSGDIEF